MNIEDFYLTYMFQTPKKIAYIQIATSSQSDTYYYNIRFQVSTDGTNWTSVGNVMNVKSSNVITLSTKLEKVFGCKYVRLIIENSNCSTIGVQNQRAFVVYEIEAYGRH